MRWLDRIIDSMDMNLSNLREIVKDGEPGVLQSMRSQRAGHGLATEQQQHTSILFIPLFKQRNRDINCSKSQSQYVTKIKVNTAISYPNTFTSSLYVTVQEKMKWEQRTQRRCRLNLASRVDRISALGERNGKGVQSRSGNTAREKQDQETRFV